MILHLIKFVLHVVLQVNFCISPEEIKLAKQVATIDEEEQSVSDQKSPRIMSFDDTGTKCPL